jgi:hypothetical protein
MNQGDLFNNHIEVLIFNKWRFPEFDKTAFNSWSVRGVLKDDKQVLPVFP